MCLRQPPAVAPARTSAHMPNAPAHMRPVQTPHGPDAGSSCGSASAAAGGGARPRCGRTPDWGAAAGVLNISQCCTPHAVLDWTKQLAFTHPRGVWNRLHSCLGSGGTMAACRLRAFTAAAAMLLCCTTLTPQTLPTPVTGAGAPVVS